MNKSGSALGPFPLALPCKPAQPRDGPTQNLPDPQLPSPQPRSAMPKYGACPPEATSLTIPNPPTPTTHHTWPQTTWKTPEIARPLLFSPSLYHRKAESSESSRSFVKVKRFPRSEGRKIGPTPWKASASHGGCSNFHSRLQSKLVRSKHFQLFIKFSSSHLLGPPIFLSCCVTLPWG